MKFAFIEAERAEFKVSDLCRVLRVSRAGFYAWRGRPESERLKEDCLLALKVTEAWLRGRKTYGSPRVHRELKEQGICVSRKRVIRLMQEQGLVGKAQPSFVVTTDSAHSLPAAPNVLAQDFTASAPNQRWVGDITYLKTPQGWLYLAVVIDLYSRFVVGWALSPIIDRHLVLGALEMALKRRCPQPGLVSHSDRGSQYAAEDYQRALTASGITCSMSRRGNCLDNAVAESWFATLKRELGEKYASHAHAQEQLFDYIEVFFNQHRRHSTLGYLSPAEYERRFATLRAVA